MAAWESLGDNPLELSWDKIIRHACKANAGNWSRYDDLPLQTPGRVRHRLVVRRGET